ncbi:MAG: choice-of-anchor J domain-containing protein, partial [Bacteroidales bacterium]|nr:choice-of-anchor J domain-containing protein [Bacteroidales bacterium]
KNTSKYEIVGEGGGNTGGDTPSTGDGNGSYESPFYPANVIALNPTSTTEAPAGGAGVWVKGFIVGHMPSTNTLLENTVFGVSSDVKTNIVLAPTAGCKDYTQCISVQLPSGAVRNALNFMQNPDMLGAEVLLYGDVMKYCGAPGLKNTSKYEIVGEGGGNTGGGGDTPSTGGNTIYEGLISHCDDWTFENVNLPDAATYIWSWKEYNGSYYLNASAYVGGAAHASEAYAYTTLDLTGKSSASLTFDHAAKFQTSLQELCAVVVRVQGTTAWTALNMPTWPEAGTWTFVNCGSISLNAYVGKKIEIGFRYGSRDGGADTWEIKNFIVTGN